VKVMTSKVELHCALEAATLLNLREREGEGHRRNYLTF